VFFLICYFYFSKACQELLVWHHVQQGDIFHFADGSTLNKFIIANDTSTTETAHMKWRSHSNPLHTLYI